MKYSTVMGNEFLEQLPSHMYRLSGLGIRTASAILVRTAGCSSIEVDFNSTPRLKVLNVRSESVKPEFVLRVQPEPSRPKGQAP
jgi:hypothetical protein